MKDTGGIFQDLEYNIQLAMVEGKAWWWEIILPETMFCKRWRDGWGERDKEDENFQRLFFLMYNNIIVFKHGFHFLFIP